MSCVLLVDDDPSTADALAALVRHAGHTAEAVGDGAAAAAALTGDAAAALPDLVILDLMMPGLDGVELLRRLRASERTRHLPVIVFTAVSDPTSIASVMWMGANEVWVKTRFDFAELPRRLRRYIPAA